ncbi:hypothetical protein AB6G19_22150 [Providencia manganoxydans]
MGTCEFELSENQTVKLSGIQFLMSVVESLYQDKTLQPLLLNSKKPLFSQQKP